VDHLASPAVAGFSVSTIKGQGPRVDRRCANRSHARGRWPQGPTNSIAAALSVVNRDGLGGGRDAFGADESPVQAPHQRV